MSHNSAPPANRKPLLVALTGGIASGKTAAAEKFASLGATVLDTDQIARDIVAIGTPALAQIIEQFGKDILTPEGNLDRRRMREKVFADPEQRKLLESITHPAIRQELARRAASATGPYQIHVIPLLVEGGSASAYDRVLVVDCPEETQLHRLIVRDNSDKAQAEQILRAQVSRAERLSVADDVIENTGSLAELQSRVQVLHERYLRLATLRNQGG